MSWFWTVIFLIAALGNFSEAKNQKELPSAVVVGTVYCDTCFQQDSPKARHFISGASVAVECKDSKPSFRQEAKTDIHGEFKVHLPFPVSKHLKKIRGCSVKLISSNNPLCDVASTATSSSLHLKSRKEGTHIFSAGFFKYKPLKQPHLCNQKPNILETLKRNAEKKLSPISNPNDPTFLPPIQDPPSDPPALGQLPNLPLLPPLPRLLDLPKLPLLPPVPDKETAAKAKASHLQDKKAISFQFTPNPFNPPSVFPPNPFQPSSSPPPSILPPLLSFPSPQFFNLPPIPGLTPSPPPAPTFRFPLPPFPFRPMPGFPGVPPAEVSSQSKTKSP